jgi:Tol biopolymer transport system component
LLPVFIGVSPPTAIGVTANTSTARGKLVVVRFVSLDKPVQMLTVNDDGSALRPLAGVVDGAHPAWSHDGRRIAYQKEGSIFIVNANGVGKRVELTPPGPDEYRNPRWSPDGRNIVFDSYELGRDEQLEIWRVDGSHRSVVPLPMDANGPDWSPDGRRLAFWNLNGIYVVNVNGTGLKKITSQWREVRWSPDGKTLLFIGQGGRIFTASPHGGPLAPVAPTSSATTVSWSPDGKQIAYDSGRSGTAIHIVDLATRRDRVLKLRPCASPASCQDLDWQRVPAKS